MKRLLKIEFTKVKFHSATWILIGLHALLFVPTAFGLESVLNGFLGLFMPPEAMQPGPDGQPEQFVEIFRYPVVWYLLTYLAGWFKLILAIVVIIWVTNDISSKVMRQNIIDGMSKREVILAKELMIIGLSLGTTIFMGVLTLIVGENTPEASFFDGIEFLLAYFLMLFTYLNFAFFAAMWLRGAGMAIGMLFLYTIVIENLLTGIFNWLLPEGASVFLPINAFNSFIPGPGETFKGAEMVANFGILNISICLAYMGAFIYLIHTFLKRGYSIK